VATNARRVEYELQPYGLTQSSHVSIKKSVVTPENLGITVLCNMKKFNISYFHFLEPYLLKYSVDLQAVMNI